MQIQEIAQLIADSQLNLEEKVAWHLRCNFDKPLPKAMIPVALQAIMLDSYGFDWNTTELELPTGSTYFGEQRASIGAIIEGHELRYFLMETEDNKARRHNDSQKAGDNYVI